MFFCLKNCKQNSVYFCAVCKYFSQRRKVSQSICVRLFYTKSTEDTEYCSAGCRFFSTDYTVFFHAEKIDFHAEKINFHAEKKKFHALVIKFPCLGKKITRVGNKITRVGNKLEGRPMTCTEFS